MTTHPCQSTTQDHDSTEHGEQKSRWLDGQMIEPLELAGNEAVADLVDHVYARSGFNARLLAEGAQLYARMLEADATVCVTVAGAMTPIGMSGVLISLIEKGFVDLIISTGANLFHDLHRPFDFPLVQGDPHADDNALAEDGVSRIYDIFVGNDDTLTDADSLPHDAAAALEDVRSYSTATLHHKLGELVWEKAPHAEKSMVAAAAKYDVPIYTSSPGDSAVGMNLAVRRLAGRHIGLDPMLDVLETAAFVRDAKLNGVVQIGGGSPKNFYLQTQPMLQQLLLDKVKGGHDFCLQLTADSPHWGGLSGATPSEAKSWGKLRDARKDNVVVYSCASITFPLIAQYALSRVEPRKHRRLFGRIAEVTDTMRKAAEDNPELAEELPDVYGKKGRTDAGT